MLQCMLLDGATGAHLEMSKEADMSNDHVSQKISALLAQREFIE